MHVPMNVRNFLDRGFTYFADRVAIVDEPGEPGGLGSITYRELGQRARGMAVELDRMGIDRGERIAIVSPNAARFLIALFGVSGYERVLVPINYRLGQEEIAYIIEHSGASVLLVDPQCQHQCARTSVKHRFVLDGVEDEALFAPSDDAAGAPTSDEDSTVSINYTSGTTARPKGVELTHRNLWINAMTFGWHLGVSEADVYLHTLPMFHCNGWGMPYALAAMGARQVVLRKIDGDEILDRVRREGVTLLCGAPAVVNTILDASTRRNEHDGATGETGNVRIVVAGAPTPTRTVERVESELRWEYIQAYGLTETSPILTINRAPRSSWEPSTSDERSRRLARAGVPCVGVDIAIDPSGEVLARANQVFTGYWSQSEETAQALEGGWFHTGDVGYLDDDRVLVITDRRKDVIITGGENVSATEVEDCLYQHPDVAEAAVIGVPHDRWGETVKALVVTKNGVDVSPAALIEHCRAHLAHFKCPTSVEFRSALERTATGKLQKYKLRAPYWADGAQQML